MKKIFALLTVFVFVSSFAFAEDYIRRTEGGYSFVPVLDNVYLRLDASNSDDTTGSFEFFKDLVVGAGVDGNSFSIYRNADYIRTFVDQYGSGNLYTNSAMIFNANGGSNSLWAYFSTFNLNYGGATPNASVDLYGTITGVGWKYVRLQVSDVDDYFWLTRQDANILGHKIGMPTYVIDNNLGIISTTDNATDSAVLSVNRIAPEGSNYLNIKINDDQVAWIESDWDISIRSNLAGGVIELGAIATNIVRLIGTTNCIGEPTGTKNLPLRHYGYITNGAAQRYITWLVDDTDDYFHLTSSDLTKLLGFKIEMPTTVTNLTDSGLTITRIPYASTGGLLVDSANLTFDGTNLTDLGLITGKNFTSNGVFTATAATTNYNNITPSLTAHANSDTLCALYVNPTFADAGYTSVAHYAAQFTDRVYISGTTDSYGRLLSTVKTNYDLSTGNTKQSVTISAFGSTGGSKSLYGSLYDVRYAGSAAQSGSILAMGGQIYNTGTGNSTNSYGMFFDLYQATDATATAFFGSYIAGHIVNANIGIVGTYYGYYDAGMDFEDGSGTSAYNFYGAAHSKWTGGAILSAATADAGASVVFQTDVAHGLKTGAWVIIAGTTDYNGLEQITDVSDTTHFKITDTFVSDQSGTWSGSGCVNAYGLYLAKQTIGQTINNEIFLASTGGIFFRDQAIKICSSVDTQLNLVADGSVEVNAPVLNGIRAYFVGNTAQEVLGLNQTDDNEAFIDFIGTSAADATKSISTWTVATIKGYVKCEVNGVAGWIAIYNSPTS